MFLPKYRVLKTIIGLALFCCYCSVEQVDNCASPSGDMVMWSTHFRFPPYSPRNKRSRFTKVKENCLRSKPCGRVSRGRTRQGHGLETLSDSRKTAFSCPYCFVRRRQGMQKVRIKSAWISEASPMRDTLQQRRQGSNTSN